MEQSLAGKVVMVTGAASGIGRATSKLLAMKGASIVAADLNAEGGEEVVAEIVRDGGNAIFSRTDITNGDQVNATVDLAVREFGKLDGAFNNAGYTPPNAGFLEGDYDHYQKVTDINMKSVWLCMRAQLTQLKLQGTGGSIVNTSSAGGLRGMSKQAIYSGCKHAVIGFTKSAALEFARRNIRINAICPGVIDTPMTRGVIADDEKIEKAFLSWQPSGRFGQAEEIGEAAAWLLSDASSFVTGIAMSVDGGVMA